jgi:RND family efflux transporter MFP subunit
MRAIDGPAGAAGQLTAAKGARRRVRVVGALVAAAAGGAVAVAFLRPPAAPAGEAPAAREQLVTAFAVAPREFVRTAPVSGEVRPYEDVQVFASAPGVRIAEVLADIGDEVAAGAPLARLDAGVAEAQINAARAEYEQARIEEARAAAEYARIAAIADTGALSKEEIETRRAAAAAAKARAAAQRAALAEVSARLNGGFVVAPVAGLVIARNARVGGFADQQALFRIVGGGRLEVAGAVAENDILALRAGQVAKFRTGDGAVVEAVLRRPPVAVDAESRVGEALFDLPAGAEVRTGMYLRGEVELETTRALAAPATAITYAAGAPSVFVLRDGKAHLTPVTLGPRSGDFVAIVSGLAAGEEIAAAGGAFLLDGDPVRVARPDAVVAGG